MYRVVSSVHTNFRIESSLAPKRLLFVSYKSQKRAAKYSLVFFTVQKEAIRELQNIVRMRHSVPHVCENSFLRGSTSIGHPAYHQRERDMKLDHVSLCAPRKIVLTLLVADKMAV